MNPRRRRRLRAQKEAGTQYGQRLSLVDAQLVIDDRADDHEVASRAADRAKRGPAVQGHPYPRR